MIDDRNQQSLLSVNDFSMSKAYFHHDDMTWCVGQAKPMPAWMNFYYLSARDTIIPGCLLLFSVIFFAYLLSSFEKNPLDKWTSMLLVIQIMAQTSSQFNPKCPMLQSFFAGGLFIMMASATIFLAYYYDYMLLSRHEKQTDSFDQLKTHQFLLAGDKYTKDYLMEQNLVNRDYFDCDRFLTPINNNRF